MLRIIVSASLAGALLLAAVAALAAAPPSAAARPLLGLCEALAERATRLDAHVGLVVVDLRDGARCEANATQTFPTASLYKLIVLAEAYEQAARGDLDFDEPIELKAEHYVDDPPDAIPEEMPEFDVRETLRRMIAFSDNASAHALRERLGKGAVAAAPARLGLDGTVLGATFVTTPDDMARFFAALYRGEIVDAGASAEMLALLLTQELNDLVPYALPDGTAVAHKTGLVPHYLHDAGIVYAPGGDFVLVLLTHWEDDIEQSYEAIHALTALAYAAFEQPAPLVRTEPVAVGAAAGEPGALDRPLVRPTAKPGDADAVEPAAPLAAAAEPAWWRDQRGVLAVAAGAVALLMVLVATVLGARSR